MYTYLYFVFLSFSPLCCRIELLDENNLGVFDMFCSTVEIINKVKLLLNKKDSNEILVKTLFFLILSQFLKLLRFLIKFLL